MSLESRLISHTFGPITTLQILSLLGKDDLKNARLFSQSWRECSSQFLFGTLYVSTQDEDYDIFKAVTQDPLLSKCVTTLEYDSVAFATNISISDYTSRLWDQVSRIVHRDPNGQDEHFDSPNADINKLVDLLRKRPMSGDNGYEAYENEAQNMCAGMLFVQEGYTDWKRRAEQEMELKASKRFARGLVQGLRNLSRLDSVRLSGAWPFMVAQLSSIATLPKVCHSSPLARQWNIFQAYPLSWYWGPNTGGYEYPQGIPEFRTFTTALALAEKRPREFQCYDSIPPTAFDFDEKFEIPSMWLFCLDVYRDLHSLDLSLASYGNKSDLREQDRLKGLQSLLSDAKHLQRLKLTLPEDYDNLSERAKLFCYDKVFPECAQWPKLILLSVKNLSLHMKDFIQLFSLSGMENLKHLAVENIELLSGSWEAAIEILKHTLGHGGLETLLIQGFLYDGSPERLLIVSSDGSDQTTFFKKIQEYVVNGRKDRHLRHPCLLASEPYQTPLGYLRDAQESCEKTGADASVLKKLEFYIECTTAMYCPS